MGTVQITLSALPVHVRTARLVATAVARRTGLAERYLDEVRIAVGEACSRAVDLHQRWAPDEPVRLEITDEPTRFRIVVSDAAPEGAELPVANTQVLGTGVFDPAAMAAPAVTPAGPTAVPLADGDRPSPPVPALADGDRPAPIAAPAAAVDPYDASLSLLDFLPAGFGIAVIRGLVDDVEVSEDPSGAGTRIAMSWPVGAPAAG